MGQSDGGCVRWMMLCVLVGVDTFIRMYVGCVSARPHLIHTHQADDQRAHLNYPTGSVFEFHLYTWAFGETPDDKVGWSLIPLLFVLMYGWVDDWLATDGRLLDGAGVGL